MHINFYLYDEEEEEVNIASNFNVYCSNDLLKVCKLNKDDNAVIICYSRNEQNEEKSSYVCCCFKNYGDLHMKKKLEHNGIYTNRYVLKSLYYDNPNRIKKGSNKNGKPVNLNVDIKKVGLYTPIKEIKLNVREMFNESYEYLKEFYYSENSTMLQTFWMNIKNKNMEKYINLSLLNTCLFTHNFLKISILGVHTYLSVEQLTVHNEKKKKKKNSLNKISLDHNFYVPFVSENTKIVILPYEEGGVESNTLNIAEINRNDASKSGIKKGNNKNTNEGSENVNGKLDLQPDGRSSRYSNNGAHSNECKNMKKSKRETNYLKKKMGLNKIGGYSKIKEDIYYYILLPLIYKNIYDEYNIDFNRGILLHGPPGCGKTFIALAIKEELSLLRNKLNGAKLKKKMDYMGNLKHGIPNQKDVQKYENEKKKMLDMTFNDDIILPEMEILKSTDLIDTNNSGIKINELFLRCYKRYMEEKKCSIIFIDEIEILCEKREETNINLYTSTLLNNIDGIKKYAYTILIGATNYINKIDLALRRSGRFDKDMEINIPNLKDRISIFKKRLAKINHDISAKKIKLLADMCQSFTCSDINALINISMYINLKQNKVISRKIFSKCVKWSPVKAQDLQPMHNTGKEESIMEKRESGSKGAKVGEMGRDESPKMDQKDMGETAKVESKESPNGGFAKKEGIYDKINYETPLKPKSTKWTKEPSFLLKYRHLVKGLKYVKPSGMKELYVDIPKTRIKDIGGYKFVKRCIKECLIYPKKYKNIYEKYNIQSPKGILLYGPPGCSKTLFAKAVASEINMNFISVKGPEIFSKYVGESEKAIRNIFKKARENNPCVIFFDEIDSIAVSRNVNQNFVSNRVLCQLLNEIDGISNRVDVIILAATNRPDFIDPALLRPGRFDRIIYVPLPNYTSRLSILKKTLKFYKINNIIGQGQEGVTLAAEEVEETEEAKEENDEIEEKIHASTATNQKAIKQAENINRGQLNSHVVSKNLEKIRNSNYNMSNEKHYFESNTNTYNLIPTRQEEVEEKLIYKEFGDSMSQLKRQERKYSYHLWYNSEGVIIQNARDEQNKKQRSRNNNTKRTGKINNVCANDSNFLQLCHFLAKKTKKYSGAEIVNICREASICALRETLKKYKNEKHMKEDFFSIKNNNHNSNNIVGLRKGHFVKVLKKIKPQTSDELLNFYKNYARGRN
ncbi:AAA family ATPase, putative [Plasmodium malariae]|uniref:AAA family ATPase, putative n=1 Tax=Plasmodium malariae TaxID=5858 RepID=A0A1C3KFL1_PLAMA|nr:AAA family ATPase, putative [Plasmodium malariae]